ncbi:PhoU domain-containing protein [Actinoallomurus sp. NPDC050550]|uniref:PhoU domain-containing protein n=1 Tax=Actinoallomurus sp. NPDC050550 TaxID=3154937 RepID=UPI0033E7AA78
MTQADDQRLACQWAVMLGVARTALSRASAVLFGDEAAAEDSMKEAEQALHELREAIEEIEETALATPYGTSASSDVRVTVAVVHLGGDMERLAKLIQQIAEIAWSRRSKRPLPAYLWAAAERMSGGVLALVDRAGETMTLEPTTAEAATALSGQVGEIAEQQRLLDRLLVSEGPPVEVSDAVDVVLLGRCYEGCARHAVSAARHVAMLAT